MPVINAVVGCTDKAASWSSGDTIATIALIVAALTGAVACLAFLASLTQFRDSQAHNERVRLDNQRHNELSVRPLLDIEIELWKPDGEAGVWLVNDGYGAAILKKLGARLDGVTFDVFDPLQLRDFSLTIGAGHERLRASDSSRALPRAPRSKAGSLRPAKTEAERAPAQKPVRFAYERCRCNQVRQDVLPPLWQRWVPRIQRPIPWPGAGMPRVQCTPRRSRPRSKVLRSAAGKVTAR